MNSIFLRKQRKASLQLSINAIVILVMAMVVLGLGLGFIRGMFESGTKKLGKAISNADLKNPANAQNRLTVDNSVDLKKRGEAIIEIGYYNIDSTEKTITVKDLACEGLDTDGIDADQLALRSVPIVIKSASSAGIRVIIEDVSPAANSIDEGSYVCGFKVGPQGEGDTSFLSGQFFLKVAN